jgi:hypothetical protein
LIPLVDLYPEAQPGIRTAHNLHQESLPNPSTKGIPTRKTTPEGSAQIFEEGGRREVQTQEARPKDTRGLPDINIKRRPGTQPGTHGQIKEDSKSKAPYQGQDVWPDPKQPTTRRRSRATKASLRGEFIN